MAYEVVFTGRRGHVGLHFIGSQEICLAKKEVNLESYLRRFSSITKFNANENNVKISCVKNCLHFRKALQTSELMLTYGYIFSEIC